MKHLFFYIVFSLFTINCFSQISSEPIYVVLTTTASGEYLRDGISRSTLPASHKYNLGKYPPIFFPIKADGQTFSFVHYNIDLEKLRTIRQPHKDGSDEMGMITKPESFLKEVSYFDLDEFMKTRPTKDQMWDLGEKLQFKKIYVIDRNEIKDGQMTLYETRLVGFTKPHKAGDTVVVNGKKYITSW
jgi:hypothetical protein